MSLSKRHGVSTHDLGTQVWLDFLEKRLENSLSRIQLGISTVRFKNRGSQEFWRFKILLNKESDTISWLRAIAQKYPDATLVDVGANFGIYSIFWLVTSRGRVICIEPLSANALALEGNLALNLFRGRSQINVGAASNASEFAWLSAPSNRRGEGYGALGTRNTATSLGTEFLTPTLRLDKLDLRHHELVVKVDVEDAELEVLQGMSRPLEQGYVKAVLFKKSSRQEEVIDYLANYGFYRGPDFQQLGNIIMSRDPKFSCK